MVLINYHKNNNNNIFKFFKNNKYINIENMQNYIPIYSTFFSLNDTNFNSINLNHTLSIHAIESCTNDHVFVSVLKNNNTNELTQNQKVFIKFAPLIDPLKYICGKCDYDNTKLFNLPTFDNSNINDKIHNYNNSAYIDGFFSFLTSQLLNTHNFVHGNNFYGSFLGTKHNFKINVIDDIEYLNESSFFKEHIGKLFSIEDYSHLIEESIKPLKPLNINNTSIKSLGQLDILDESIFFGIFNDFSTNHLDNIQTTIHYDNNCCIEEMSNVHILNVQNINLLNNNNTNIIHSHNNSETLNSLSNCSSRSSYTNDDIDSNIDLSQYNNCSKNKENNNISDDEDNVSDNSGGDSGSDSGSSSSDSSSNNEPEIWLTIPKFPVNVICTEYYENTLDYLILSNKLNDDEWFSALMQIIMMLITYQQMFSFTHNDLHTNNVMFTTTDISYLYYKCENVYYKVPTYGKLYKIIDFGRAIYKVNGKIFCSDSFQSGGDASTQYNTEPFFNEKKPRVEPNFSFDLCRLGCSIFDYLVDDLDEIKNINKCSDLIKIITEWCTDDNGNNILYKSNGHERYPEFKLYKMISRCVHNCVPKSQLNKSYFKKYIVSKKKISSTTPIMNIDIYKSYVNSI